MKLDHLNITTNIKNTGFSTSHGISSISNNFIALSNISECLTQFKNSLKEWIAVHNDE